MVGSQIELDGEPVTVLGVMPAGFYFPDPEWEIFRPLTVDPASEDYSGNHWLTVFGRTGVELTEPLRPRSSASPVCSASAFDYPDAYDKSRGAYVEPLREYFLGAVRPALYLLMVAVVLLLLMASSNVAAMLVARLSDRGNEFSVRRALGASRGRLARQLLAESLVLGSLGTLAGLAIAVLAWNGLIERLPLPSGFDQAVALDGRLFLLAVLLGAPGVFARGSRAPAPPLAWSRSRAWCSGVPAREPPAAPGCARGGDRAGALDWCGLDGSQRAQALCPRSWL